MPTTHSPGDLANDPRRFFALREDPCDSETMGNFAQYRVLGLLGRGGMGSVYLAEQTGPRGFCRQVVLKFIRFDDSVGEDRRRRLGDEAQLTALVDHPNVVKLLEVKEHDGKLFMALERVIGINFLMLLKRVPERRLPPGLAAALMAQVCDGLHAIHEARQGLRPLNIIHRDVTPMNLMLDTSGRVRVIDLGIARADVRESVTAASQIQGNLAYMAPEQWNGLPLDRTVDVYAAALVFYELCIGTHPFDRTIRRCELPPLRQHCPEVTPDLSTLVGEALALDPAQRPPQIAILGRAFADYARSEGFPGPAQVADHFAHASVPLSPPEPRPLDQLDELDWLPAARDDGDTRPVPVQPPPPPPPPPPQSRRPPSTLPPPLNGLGEPRIILNEGGFRETRLPGGRVLFIYTTWLDAHLRGPRRLALSAVPDLLPGSLLVTFQGSALSIHTEPGSERAGRTSLYLDASVPSTRLEQLLLGPGAPPQTFDFGHRRHTVRRIFLAEGRRIQDECIVHIDDPPLAIVAPRECARLVVLTVPDADLRRVYLEALCTRW